MLTAEEVQQVIDAIRSSNDPSLTRDAHSYSDLDFSTSAQHHTLGIQPGQASPGNHKHDGRTSRKLSFTDLTEAGAYLPGSVGLSQTNAVSLTAASFQRYKLLSKTAHVQALYVASATTSASGNLIASVPFNPANTNGLIEMGTFTTAGAVYRVGKVYYFAGNLVAFRPHGASTNIGNGDGYVMPAGDWLTMNLMYEVA